MEPFALSSAWAAFIVTAGKRLPDLQFRHDEYSRGRVLQKLFERIAEIEKDLDPKRTGKVFNVLGSIPSNQLEKMLRDMYAHNQMTEELIKQRIVEQVDPEHFRSITNSTLEDWPNASSTSPPLSVSPPNQGTPLVPESNRGLLSQAAPVNGVEVSEQARGSTLQGSPLPATFGPSVSGWSRGSESWAVNINRCLRQGDP